MKISSYDLHQLPQEAIDNIEDIRVLLNFGKYQPQVVTSIPTFNGRYGEFAILFQGDTGRLYWCTTDNKNTWAPLS